MGRWIAVLFAILGAGLIAGGVHFAEQANHFGRGSAKATGTVVEIEKGYDSDGVMYYPVVEYVSGGDQLIRFRSGVGTSWEIYAVGEEVKVIYSPEDPDQAKIDAPMQLYFVPVVLFTIGGVFFVVGTTIYIVFTFAMGKRRKSVK